MKMPRLDFSDVSLYAVTGGVKNPTELLKKLEKMLAVGLDAFQLRCKNLTDREYLQLARQVRSLCTQHNALFFVNNRPDLALFVSLI